MKGWVFPLVLLIGWFSIVPCCDAANHKEAEVDRCTGESQTAGEECPDELPCSPFYSCGACAGCISPKTLLLDLKAANQPVSLLFFDYSFKLPIGDLFLPLKPPRTFFQLA